MNCSRRFSQDVYKKIFLGQESEYLKKGGKKKFLFRSFFTSQQAGEPLQIYFVICNKIKD
jgi:hypothetical protein